MLPRMRSTQEEDISILVPMAVPFNVGVEGEIVMVKGQEKLCRRTGKGKATSIGQESVRDVGI